MKASSNDGPGSPHPAGIAQCGAGANERAPASIAGRLCRAAQRGLVLGAMALPAAGTPLAALAAGTLDASFTPPAWQAGSRVGTLALQADGRVLAGGYFVDSGGVIVQGVLRLNADGSRDASFTPALTDGDVSSILVQFDGKVLISGYASTVNGRATGPFARLNADGTLDAGFVPAQANARVKAFAVQPDGKILIGGTFSAVGGTSIAAIARLNADGTLDAGFSSPISDTYLSFLSGVTSIALRPDGRILLAGNFCAPADAACNTTAAAVRLNTDGSLDTDLTAASGLDDAEGFAIVAHPDGTTLVAGYSSFRRLSAADTWDTSFDPQPTGFVNSIVVQPDGRVLVAGAFIDIGGGPRTHIARLNADGSADASFDGDGSGNPNDQVYTLAAQADGRVLVGGSFGSVGAQQVARPGVARLLIPDGAMQQLGFGADHGTLRWQRGGAGAEFGRVTFESSTDGSAWSPLGDGAWNPGTWNLVAPNLPTNTSLWLRARGQVLSGGGYTGFSGSVNEAVRQVVAKVTPSAGTGGHIAPAAPQFVDAGSTLAFTITPDAGQRILSVGGSCSGTLAGSVYTVVAIERDCTLQVAFTAAANFVVTPSTGSGGQITPSSPQGVMPGGRAAFQLTSDTGYAIDHVGGTCGGDLAGNVYTTAPVQADCSVEAAFTIQTYTVTATAGANGSVTPAVQVVPYGSTAVVSVVPQFGYNAQVSGCGGTLNGITYATAPIMADCLVDAGFAPRSEAGTSLTYTLMPAQYGVACGTQSAITAKVGDYVYPCYTLKNNSGRTLPWHYLASTGSGASYWHDYPNHAPLADYGVAPTIAAPILVTRSLDIEARWNALEQAPPRYTFDDTAAFDWIELAGSAAATRLPIDMHVPYGEAQVELPFSFDFYGLPTDGRLCVNKNGWMNFNSGQPCIDYSNTMVIAPAQSGIFGVTYPYVGGDIYYATLGTAPNRRAVVEWSNVTLPYDNDPGVPMAFQAVIEEAGGAITFQYRSMDTGTATARGQFAQALLRRERSFRPTAAPDQALVYSDAQPRLTSGKAVRFTPTASAFVATATAQGHVRVEAPQAQVSPGSLGVDVAAGTTAAAVLEIGNSGNAPLVWSLGQAPARSGFVIDTAYPPTAQTAEARAAAASWSTGRKDDARRAALAAPRTRSAAEASPSPRASGAVPAYALAYTGPSSRLMSLDAAAPEALTFVSWDVYLDPVQVATVIDNDFSRVYLMANDSCNNDGCFLGSFGMLDTSTGHTTNLAGAGTMPYVPQTSELLSWAGVKWDATTHTLYGIATNAGPGNNYPFASCGTDPLCRSDLFTIDPATGKSTWVAQIDSIDPVYGTNLADIAIAPDGAMIGLNMIDDTFYRIDKVTGHVRPLGPSGLAVGYWPGQSMDFDQTTGVLYYATWPDGDLPSSMYTVDLETGSATSLGMTGDGTTFLRGLSITLPGGPCLTPGDVPWLSFRTGGGTLQPGDSSSVSIAFDASRLAPGEHHAKLCVDSNTPFRSMTAVPVTLNVGVSDRLFADGFD